MNRSDGGTFTVSSVLITGLLCEDTNDTGIIHQFCCSLNTLKKLEQKMFIFADRYLLSLSIVGNYKCQISHLICFISSSQKLLTFETINCGNISDVICQANFFQSVKK